MKISIIGHANSNTPQPREVSFTLDQMVEASGLDEDTLLQRMAGVLKDRLDSDGLPAPFVSLAKNDQ